MQHNRGRAESAPVAPNPRILFREAARPERRIPQAAPSAAGQGGNAINDGTRAVTTGEIDCRKTARRGPQFPPLRKHSTSDHIDTSVLDPDADDEAEEGEDEHDDEEEEEEEDHEEETQRRTSSSGESGSGATLTDRQLTEHETIVEHPPEKRGQKAAESQPQNIDPSQAEKGEAGGLRRRTRTRTGTQTSARSFKDPETRQWKDNVCPLSLFCHIYPSLLKLILYLCRSSLSMDHMIQQILKIGLIDAKSSSLCLWASPRCAQLLLHRYLVLLYRMWQDNMGYQKRSPFSVCRFLSLVLYQVRSTSYILSETYNILRNRD